jgi:hypothetical protein
VRQGRRLPASEVADHRGEHPGLVELLELLPGLTGEGGEHHEHLGDELVVDLGREGRRDGGCRGSSLVGEMRARPRAPSPSGRQGGVRAGLGGLGGGVSGRRGLEEGLGLAGSDVGDDGARLQQNAEDQGVAVFAFEVVDDRELDVRVLCRDGLGD